MLIGLMGKSGSGKSLISMLFKELDNNIQVIDVDKIGHMSHEDSEVKQKLVESIGSQILNEDLSINRKELSKIVFNDEVKMKLLCEATYGFMVKKIDELISDDKIIILDYALLPKTKYYELCDLKILVQASYDNRSNRVVKRDNVSFEKYSRIDANSVNYSDYYFDYIIENNSDMDSLRKAIGDIYEKSIVSG